MRRLLILVLLFGSCSSPSPNRCDSSTCSGCCTETNECKDGTQRDACGFGANRCRVCGLTEDCSQNVCLVPSAGVGGGTAGGAAAGGGAVGGGAGGGATPDAGPCAGTLVWCGGQCIDTLADPSHCGVCGRLCGQGQVCNRGTCATLPSDCTASASGCGPGLSCDPITRQCAPGCRLTTDCPAVASCASGTCACPTNQHACGQRCVPDDAVTSCGAQCSACEAPTGGSVSCVNELCTGACSSGFTLSDDACVDVDECQENNGGCSAEAACTNTAGSRTCACRAGYTGDGVTCTDLNECLTNNGGCGATVTCNNAPGTFSCGCMPGFVLDGGACGDVNECATMNGGCATLATCTNTVGGRTCTCPAGYTGSGVVCSDINECTTNNGGCSANATCTNTAGGRTCACSPGYTGNGLTCTRQQDGESCGVAENLTLPDGGLAGLGFRTTTGFVNDHAASCAGASTIGPDRVFAYTLRPGRQLRVSVNASWDAVVYFVAAPATNCRASGTSCLASSDTQGAGGIEVVTYTNGTTSNRTIYVVVDSKSGGQGGSFTLNPSVF
ncbi:MAG: EGF domain-containing protein [Myxococcales bacterium]|nr:EGF domain-containing protein [Myxococcales bacterium]